MAESSTTPTGRNEIQLRRLAKGNYTWAISVAPDSGAPDDVMVALDTVRMVDQQLQQTHGAIPDPPVSQWER